jgi:hypothetical protein
MRLKFESTGIMKSLVIFFFSFPFVLWGRTTNIRTLESNKTTLEKLMGFAFHFSKFQYFLAYWHVKAYIRRWRINEINILLL